MDTKEIEEEVIDLSEMIAHDEEKGITNVYEVGYHLLPTLDESALEAEVAKITDALKKANADFVGERSPALVDLAYSVEKKIEGKRQSFDTAYFGWIAFEVLPSTLEAFEEVLKEQEQILRYVVLKTSRDSVVATMADPDLDVGSPKPEVVEEEIEDSETAPEEEAKKVEDKEEV